METLQSSINGTLAAGTESFGAWDTYKGGRITTAFAERRAPGATFARKIPGRKSIESVTLSKPYDPVTDALMLERLETLCGTNTVFTVGKVERDGPNIIRVPTRVGILLEVMEAEGDTNSDTDLATVEVVIGING